MSRTEATETADGGTAQAAPAAREEMPGMMGTASASLGPGVLARKLAARRQRGSGGDSGAQAEGTQATPGAQGVDAPATASAQGADPQRTSGAQAVETQGGGQQAADPAALLREATRAHDQLLHQIRDVEDGTAGRASKNVTAGGTAAGPAADLRVETALGRELDAARTARTAAEAARGPHRAAAVETYRQAVEALRAAYLESPLYSTDDLGIRGGSPWTRIAGSRELLSDVSPQQLQAWQDALGYVKFAVPVVPDPHRIVVGNLSHVELAMGPVVAAGLLLFQFQGTARPTVGELENTSGGFRPGPLRNATAATAITAAGYTIATAAAHANETGNYDHSSIAPGGHRRAPVTPPPTPQ